MKYYTCKNYIESIKIKLIESDSLFDNNLILNKITKLIIENEICLCLALFKNESDFNVILQKHIDFLEDCLTLI